MFRRFCSFILMFRILAPGKSDQIEKKTLSKLDDCVAETKKHFVVPDKFNDIITAQRFLNSKSDLRLKFVCNSSHLSAQCGYLFFSVSLRSHQPTLNSHLNITVI